MSLEALLATLERDAAAEGAARLARAREEAAAILAAGEARAAERLEARRRDAAAAHARRTAGTVGQAVHAARARELEAQARLLERVRAESARRLRSLPPQEWLPLLPSLLEAGLRFTGQRGVEVRCAPQAEGALRELAAAEGIAVEVDGDLPPGLELRREAGGLRVRLTLPDRLEALWPELRLGVLQEVEKP